MKATSVSKVAQILLVLIGLTLLVSGFRWRYLSSESGVVTAMDYFSHVAIIEHLAEGDFFPNWQSEIVTEHLVSKYLPVYHGIIGFHLAALLLEKLGLPLPSAIALLMDFSFLSIFLLYLYFLRKMRKEARFYHWLLSLTVFFTLYAPMMFRGLYEGFLSQIFAHGILAWSVWAYVQGWRRLAACLCLASAFCYPDMIFFVAPLIAITGDFEKRWRILGGLVWVGFFWVLWRRANLVGPQSHSVYGFLIMCLISLNEIFDYFKDKKPVNKGLFISCVSGLLLLLLSWRPSLFGYYISKILIPFSFALALVFFNYQLRTLRSWLPLVLFVYFWPSTHNLDWADLQRFAGPSSVSNEQELKIREIKKTGDEIVQKGFCPNDHTLVIFFEEDWDQDKQAVVRGYLNARMKNFRLDGADFVDPSLHFIFGGSKHSLMKSFLNFQTSTSVENIISALGSKVPKDISEKQITFCLVADQRYREKILKHPNLKIIYEAKGFLYVGNSVPET